MGKVSLMSGGAGCFPAAVRLAYGGRKGPSTDGRAAGEGGSWLPSPPSPLSPWRGGVGFTPPLPRGEGLGGEGETTPSESRLWFPSRRIRAGALQSRASGCVLLAVRKRYAQGDPGRPRRLRVQRHRGDTR